MEAWTRKGKEQKEEEANGDTSNTEGSRVRWGINAFGSTVDETA